jgi:hypothetical protein
MSTFGFRDMRSQAELLLAPKQPLGRQIVNLNSLKLKIGGLPLPGVLSSASQLSGPIRSAFGTVLQNKSTLTALVGSLSGVLSDFDKRSAALKAGTFVPLDPFFRISTDTGVPSVDDFLSFSSLAAGQPVPAAFIAQITQRKKQLQQLSHSFSNIFSSPKPGGVTILENTSPTNYPHDDQFDLPTVPRLAQGGKAAQADSILKDKIRFTVHGVPIGSGKPSVWSRLANLTSLAGVPKLNAVVNQVFKDRKHQSTWSEPTTPYAAQFPYNKVQQTESGHVIELDDTPGAERVHMFHRSGSFIEFHPNGTVVYKNMKDGYLISMGDQFIKVNGKCHVAVDGGATFHVKGNIDIQNDGDFNIQTKGRIQRLRTEHRHAGEEDVQGRWFED